MVDEVVSEADRQIDSRAPWHGLLLSLGLIHAGAPVAMKILRRLGLETGKGEHWRQFRRLVQGDDATRFVQFVWKNGEEGELEKAVQLLSEAAAGEVLMGCFAAGESPLPPLRLVRSLLRRAGNLRIDPDREAAVLSLIRYLCQGEAPDQLRLLLERLQGLAVLRAVEILKRDGDETALPALMATWWKLSERIARDFDDPLPDDSDSEDVVTADAVCVAIGFCACRQTHPASFAQDRERSPELADAIRRHALLVEEHNALVAQFKSDSYQPGGSVDSTITDRLKSLRLELHFLDEEIRQLQRNERFRLSPAFSLWQVLVNRQRYPVAVQQGAARGLCEILLHGRMDADSRLEILDALRACVIGESADEFAEKRIQLLPGSNSEDLERALRNGVEWMVLMMERLAAAMPDVDHQAAEEVPSESFRRIRDAELLERLDGVMMGEPTAGTKIAESVQWLNRLMPGFMDFLRKYPLRLMCLDHHKKIFGNYARRACCLQLWTRFTPPKNVGEVKSRYLRLDDRTKPNSMGLVHHLLEHPALALPVIYHEHLHYDGMRGRVDAGIRNETEVLLREILFARALIAQMAPSQDSELPAFETGLVEKASEVGLEGLILQLLCDLSQERVLKGLSYGVVATYGECLTEEQAMESAMRREFGEEIAIRLANATLTWDPEIRWPELRDPRNDRLCRRFRYLVKTQAMIDHSLSPERAFEILNEPMSIALQELWNAYCARPHALVSFARAAELMSLRDIDWIRRIVQRFDFTPDVTVPPSLLEWVAKQTPVAQQGTDRSQDELDEETPETESEGGLQG